MTVDRGYFSFVGNKTPFNKDTWDDIEHLPITFKDDDGQTHEDEQAIRFLGNKHSAPLTHGQEQAGMTRETIVYLAFPKGTDKSVLAALQKYGKSKGWRVERLSTHRDPQTVKKGSIDSVLADLQGMAHTAAPLFFTSDGAEVLRLLGSLAKKSHVPWANLPPYKVNAYGNEILLQYLAPGRDPEDLQHVVQGWEMAARVIESRQPTFKSTVETVSTGVGPAVNLTVKGPFTTFHTKGASMTEAEAVVASLGQMLNKEAPPTEMTSALPGDEIQGRFEEGKPADPCENMSDEDCAEWKKQTEEHKDQFKAAGCEKLPEGPMRDNCEEKKEEGKTASLNGYVAFYKGKQIEVTAKTSLEAQQIAAKQFKAKKPHEVTVVLAEKDGKQVTHMPLFAAEDEALAVLTQMAEGCPDNLDESDEDEANVIVASLKTLWESYKKKHPKSERPPQSLIDKAKAEDKPKEESKAEDKPKRTEEEDALDSHRKQYRKRKKELEEKVEHHKTRAEEHGKTLKEIEKDPSKGKKRTEEESDGFGGTRSWEVDPKDRAEKGKADHEKEHTKTKKQLEEHTKEDEDTYAKREQQKSQDSKPKEKKRRDSLSEAERYKEDHEEATRGQGRAATSTTFEDDVLSTLEQMAEGCPDNLDESECKEWEANTDKYEDKFKTAAHHFDGKYWYGDTVFINQVQYVYPGAELKHLGFGEFVLETPDGKMDFDRGKGQDFPGQSGRSHRLYDNKGGKVVEKAIALMERAHKSEKVAVEDDILSTLEQMAEGCPDNLDESECKEWEANTDKYEDKFKTAGDFPRSATDKEAAPTYQDYVEKKKKKKEKPLDRDAWEAKVEGTGPVNQPKRKKNYHPKVKDVMDKHDLEDADADEVRAFKKDKPSSGAKVSPQVLMQRFLSKAKPETKERMKGVAPADFMKMLGAIMDDEGGKTAGCEKLPEGGMRDNCEKKKEEGAEAKEASEDGVILALEQIAKDEDKTAAPQKLMPSALKAKIPAIGSTAEDSDPIAWVKFFSPYSGGLWLITELDGQDEMFGWAELHPGMGELGYISFRELQSLKGMGGRLPLVERDLSFKPKPLSQAKSQERRAAKEAKVSLTVSAGTRVTIHANPVSRAFYKGGLPANGTSGTVTPIAFPGGKRTSLPGPGGGLIYVQFDDEDGTFMGVSSIDLIKEVAKHAAEDTVLADLTKLAAKPAKKQVTDWMWVISKDSAGGFIVTIGDPKKHGSKIKARFSGGSAKLDLKDWVRDNVGKKVSPNHVIDITGQNLVVPNWEAEFIEALPEKQQQELKLAGVDEKKSRFEEGKPADPTENMNEEDAATWKDMNEEHGDKFKKEAAEWITYTLGVLGEPGDPAEREVKQALRAFNLVNLQGTEEGWDFTVEVKREKLDDFKRVVATLRRKLNVTVYDEDYRTVRLATCACGKSADTDGDGDCSACAHKTASALTLWAAVSKAGALLGATDAEAGRNARYWEKLADSTEYDVVQLSNVPETVASQLIDFSGQPEVRSWNTGAEAWEIAKGYTKQAGCEKLPEGGMRDNCEKKKEEGSDKDKTAGIASGLYGFTKYIQSDCEAAARKLTKAATRIARKAYLKDERSAEFISTHAKRAGSLPAKILVAAFQEMGPKLAAVRKMARLAELRAELGHKVVITAGGDQTKTELKSKAATEKEAMARTHGLYGFPVKVASLGMTACHDLHSEAGYITSNLHRRRADHHEQITGFLKAHGKEAKCHYSRLLADVYPDAGMRLASQTETGSDWISWE